MMKKTSQSKNLLLIITILCVMFFVVVLAKSDHDHHHHHHHDDHPNGHKLNKAKKIYNGRRASPEEAKFMAAILLIGHTAEIICSAVIITHDMLLTAAHCFKNFSRSDIRNMVVVPRASHIDEVYNPTDEDLIRSIKAFQIHPKYEAGYDAYDLAIFKVGTRPWRLGGDDRVTVAQMPVRVKRQRLPFKAYGYGSEYGNVLTGNLNVIEYTREYPQDFLVRARAGIYNEPNIIFATKEVSHHQRLHISSGQAGGDSGGGVFLHGTVERLDRSTNRWIQIDTEILVGIHAGQRTRSETMRPRRYFFHANITTFLPWIKRFCDAQLETYPFPKPLL